MQSAPPSPVTIDPRACAQADALSTLAPGQVVAGRYRIRGEIGRGGFAVVYDAEHVGLDRRVALKVVHLHEQMPSELLARARREARNAALVRHPNVLEVFDTGSLEDGSPYLVMERLQGDTLTTRIARGDLPLAAIVETGRQLALALEALAARSLIHRDIKPDNVMLHDRGAGRLILKLVDFGISKRAQPEAGLGITREGYLVGTPSYMSPEQARGEALDIRSDIYAVGAVLYAALTGRPPHDRPSVQEAILATLHEPIEAIRSKRPECPEELERIVMRALSKAPNERYQAASELRMDLEAFAATAGLPVASQAWPARPLPRRDRVAGERMRPAQVALACVSIALLSASLTAFSRTHLAEASGTSAPSEGLPAGTGGRVAQAAVLMAVGPEQTTQRHDDAPVEKVTRSEARTTSPATPAEPKLERSLRSRPKRVAHTAEAVALPPAAPAETTVPVPRAAPDPVAREASADRGELLRQALRAYTLGHTELSARLYREVLRAYPDEPEALRGLGIVAARRGNAVEARAAFARYLQTAAHAKDADSVRRRLAALDAAP